LCTPTWAPSPPSSPFTQWPFPPSPAKYSFLVQEHIAILKLPSISAALPWSRIWNISAKWTWLNPAPSLSPQFGDCTTPNLPPFYPLSSHSFFAPQRLPKHTCGVQCFPSWPNPKSRPLLQQQQQHHRHHSLTSPSDSW
jgi:hypothetical protein